MAVGLEPTRKANVRPRTERALVLPSVAAAIERTSIDMEIADQWRREWAGSAEYGKVVEGGVTRRIARAMEVLHSSGPGARMKVMRAAYHTTAGPGVPASSYMVHASRRVYSSGFNSGYLEPPSIPSKPLEISSTPLALLQDPHAETENYKVTEPDDFEISEPSKWRSSTGGSIRMPSEESSSTDNASIIDVSKNHKSVFRKYSCDSENSDIPISRRSSGVSPLLDAPALSTLKFKSLLNGNNDWNNRRKSYSFEDASPLSETIVHSNDTLAMESSTDSGICKSTELVNENADDNSYVTYFGSKERSSHTPGNTFESWLSKNKQNHNYYKGTKFKNYRDHDVVDEDLKENNITLQPTGKVTITLPITLETDQEYETRKNYEENQRKFKKVEFCKTELHFAAETGKVNIIATDEKPPPSNDFRKRRSAFVPMRDMVEKPIMLFGEKTNDFSNESNSLSYTTSEFIENDENIAATKSILKNKIPKPKPYLLGENMAFGAHDEAKIDDGDAMSYNPTAVSLINKQLQAEKRSVGEISASFTRQHTVSTKINAIRTTNQSPPENMDANKDTYDVDREKTQKVVRIHDERNKFSSAKRTPAIIRSPTPARLKTRKLRESDLTYFGVDNVPKSIDKPKNGKPDMHEDPVLHDLFQSVRLIQQVSNSVCNSESDDAPEYQNIPMNLNYVPKPTPRIRSKYDDKPNDIDEIVLNPIIEQEISSHDDSTTYRRSKSRKQEALSSTKNRSRSEPRKSYKFNSIEKIQQADQSPRRTRDYSTPETETRHQKHATKTPTYKAKVISDDDNPIYINLKKPYERITKDAISKSEVSDNSPQKVYNRDSSTTKAHRKIDGIQSNTSKDTGKVLHKKPQTNERKSHMVFEGKQNLSPKRNTHKQKSEKCEKSHLPRHNTYSELSNDTGTNKSVESTKPYNQDNSIPAKIEHRSRSLHRHVKAAPKDVQERVTTNLKSTKDSSEKSSESEQVKVHRRQSSKDKASIRNNIEAIIPKAGKDSSQSTYNKEPATRYGSRSSRREYVINYDDKHGTVSSICKIRSGSASPRRKKGAREVGKEKFKENIKNKSSDKAALLQIEEHQRESNHVNADKKKKKSKIEKACQVL